MIVLVSSVILASAFDEPGKLDLSEVLDDAAISTVNFTEILTKLLELGVSDTDAMKFAKPIEAICQLLTVGQAMLAGLWRPATRLRSLSLGDRCCLALGLDLGAEVYTTDRAWVGLDLGVRVRVIR